MSKFHIYMPTVEDDNFDVMIKVDEEPVVKRPPSPFPVSDLLSGIYRLIQVEEHVKNELSGTATPPPLHWALRQKGQGGGSLFTI